MLPGARLAEICGLRMCDKRPVRYLADVVMCLPQESEGEEAAEARVALPQDMGRGNLAARQSRVRLQEIGPRMELEVVKVSANSPC